MPKYKPWTPTILAVMFSFTAVLQSSQDHWRYSGFFVNVPWVFMFVSFYLIQLKKENEALRSRLDVLEGKVPLEETTDNEAAVRC